jgi:hypothetical protein
MGGVLSSAAAPPPPPPPLPPPPTPPPSPPAPHPTVHIKLEGSGVFAALDALPSDKLGGVVVRACAAFPGWASDASQISLYLVAAGGSEPSDATIALAVRRLSIELTLAEAGAAPGAWLVARRSAASIASLDRAAVAEIARETSLAVAAKTVEDYERRRRSSASSLESTRAQVGGAPSSSAQGAGGMRAVHARDDALHAGRAAFLSTLPPASGGHW